MEAGTETDADPDADADADADPDADPDADADPDPDPDTDPDPDPTAGDVIIGRAGLGLRAGTASARVEGRGLGSDSCVAGALLGPTIPIAICIAAIRSFATSYPHCSTALYAAVVRSWQSANRRCIAVVSRDGDRAASSRARWMALETASAWSSVRMRAALRSTSASRRLSMSRSAAPPG
jgi:hypothetical protein